MKRFKIPFSVFLFLLCVLLSACATFVNPHKVVFQEDPCIVPVKGFTFKTCNSMHVYVDDNLLVIPGAYHTDLASIPRLFWNILPPQQANFIGPAILHDYLYDTGIKNRKDADDILYYALREGGARFSTAAIIWVAVRIWGGKHYASEVQSRGAGSENK